MIIPHLRAWSPFLGAALALSGCDLPDLGGPPSTSASLEDSSGGPALEEPEAGSESGELPVEPPAGETETEAASPILWTCTHTRGYWQTHHAEGVAKAIPWPIPEDTLLCGSTWVDILWTPPAGDPWAILAAQWIAASLNVASGADAPPAVADALARGEEVLEACEVEDRAEALALSDLLDRYNNGREGVYHCDDVPEEETDGDDSGGDTAGDTSGGDTSGGDTSGGDTSGGDTSGDDTSGGDTEDCVPVLEGGSNCGGTVFPPVG